jgi:hypothetical protein
MPSTPSPRVPPEGWLSCSGSTWSPEANKVFETAFFAAQACDANWASIAPALLAQVNKEQARSGYPRLSVQQIHQKRGNFKTLILRRPGAAAAVRARILSFPVDGEAPASAEGGSAVAGEEEEGEEGEEEGEGVGGEEEERRRRRRRQRQQDGCVEESDAVAEEEAEEGVDEDEEEDEEEEEDGEAEEEGAAGSDSRAAPVPAPARAASERKRRRGSRPTQSELWSQIGLKRSCCKACRVTFDTEQGLKAHVARKHATQDAAPQGAAPCGASPRGAVAQKKRQRTEPPPPAPAASSPRPPTAASAAALPPAALATFCGECGLRHAPAAKKCTGCGTKRVRSG